MRVLLMLCLWACNPVGHAHELESATARVTLRDGQISVTARVDLLSQMSALRGSDAEVPVGVLAMIDPAAFDALVQRLRVALREGIVLHADGRRLEILSLQLPSAETFQQLARRSAMANAVDGHAHQPLVEVVMETRVQTRPSEVRIAFPASIGPVLVTFVEPASQFVAPGGSATHRLRARPSRPSDPDAAP